MCGIWEQAANDEDIDGKTDEDDGQAECCVYVLESTSKTRGVSFVQLENGLSPRTLGS